MFWQTYKLLFPRIKTILPTNLKNKVKQRAPFLLPPSPLTKD